ncbi:MAG: ABC transporter permease [Sphingobacteriia bacterium]|nr:ABC transporter permease [Candidatus Fonsibacter lacus]
MQQQTHWDLTIKPHSKWYHLRIKEIFKYKDLLFLFVKRDFVSIYKQTILGPLWFFLQPIITAITFTVIFGNLAKISTDGLPQILFYMCGITLWNYFADTLTKTADTFSSNANIFGKVYFPRMIVPLSVVISNLIKLAIQFLLFLGIWIYYLLQSDLIHPNKMLALIPFLIILIGFMALSFGIIISSLTTKYRDLKFLVTFGIQLMMYASPIVYPLSIVPEKYKWIIIANPVTSIIETFKYAFLGVGEFSWFYLGYSTLFTIVLFMIGLVIFHRVEKSFMDTV